MSVFVDYYALLGVRPDAAQDEIEAAIEAKSEELIRLGNQHPAFEFQKHIQLEKCKLAFSSTESRMHYDRIRTSFIRRDLPATPIPVSGSGDSNCSGDSILTPVIQESVKNQHVPFFPPATTAVKELPFRVNIVGDATELGQDLIRLSFETGKPIWFGYEPAPTFKLKSSFKTSAEAKSEEDNSKVKQVEPKSGVKQELVKDVRIDVNGTQITTITKNGEIIYRKKENLNRTETKRI